MGEWASPRAVIHSPGLKVTLAQPEGFGYIRRMSDRLIQISSHLAAAVAKAESEHADAALQGVTGDDGRHPPRT